MKLHLDNGTVLEVSGAETQIRPLPNRQFNVDDPNTWESDRAWTFQVGHQIWTGQDNEIATITAIS